MQREADLSEVVTPDEVRAASAQEQFAAVVEQRPVRPGLGEADGRALYRGAPLIDVGNGPEQVFDNVYEALIARLWLHEQSGIAWHLLYRGQLDCDWPLEASYYRSGPTRGFPRTRRDELIAYSRAMLGGEVVAADELSEVERRALIGRLVAMYPHVSLANLRPIEQDAVLQHYLSGTKLLDFTTSLYVAAFFATFADPSMPMPGMGAIYMISPTEVERLEMARVDTPNLPDRFLRIHRQEGCFLSLRTPHGMNDRALWDRIVFRQTSTAWPFQCKRFGVSEPGLLPPEI